MSGLDLLIEVGTEEIPAGYLAPALAALEERLGRALSESNLGGGGIKTWATPRRLAAAVRGLADRQPDRELEVTGPSLKVARSQDGSWTKAAIGFAKGQGVEVSELRVVETDKGPKVLARKEIKGRPAAEVLTDILPPLLLNLPFPKSMRWGRGEVTFVRPIQWLLALLGDEVLPMSLGDIQASNQSRGHRFLHPGPVEIRSADEYEARLAQAQVILSTARREELVHEETRRAVAEAVAGTEVLADEALGLRWPTWSRRRRLFWGDSKNLSSIFPKRS